MENQNASAEYPHIPAKGSLQAVLPMAALRSLTPLQWRQGMESPCVGGRSSFFQIAAFLLREGGGVSPATLECRLIQPLALRRGVRSCFRKQCGLLMETASSAGRFRHLCSKKLIYPI